MLVQTSDDLGSRLKMLLEPVSMSGGFLFLANAGKPGPMVECIGKSLACRTYAGLEPV
jgi:hypothetical protein